MNRKLIVASAGVRKSQPVKPIAGRRGGSLFHHTLVYMTIASALLTITGLVLHTALKADQSDRRESLFLTSLLRAEQQLRADAGQSPLTVNSSREMAAQFSADAAEATRILWTADRGILTRSVRQGEKPDSSDRFIFPAGSQIEFLQAEGETKPTGEVQTTPVIVKITEPSALVTYQAAADGGTNRNKPAAEASPALPAAVARPKTVEIRLQGAPQ